MSDTHDVGAVGVVERARGAAVARQHVGHVLRLVLGEADEADARAGEHFQFMLLLQTPGNASKLVKVFVYCLMDAMWH